jgi:hypothetical protein
MLEWYPPIGYLAGMVPDRLPVESAPLAPDECLDLEHPETIQGRDFLLTYHRSGTNLTLGILPLDVSPSARA